MRLNYKALNQLMKYGKVAIMRDLFGGWVKVGEHINVYDLRGKVRARTLVIGVYTNTNYFRERFVNISGYKDVNEWLEQSKRNNKIPSHIIILKLTGGRIKYEQK